MFLRKGMCFCTDCFRHFEANKAVYIARVDDDNGQLTLNIRFRKKNLVLTPEVWNGKAKLPIVGKAVVNSEGGVVSSVRVTVKLNNSEVEVRSDETLRVCPHCGTVGERLHFLPPLMGYSDAYLVNMIGLHDVGKTSYANSVMTDRNQNELSRFLNVHITGDRIDSREVSEATTKNKLIIRRCMKIEARHRPIVVFFGDVAGESFVMDDETGHDNFQIDFLDMLRNNSDAILLLHDQRDVNVMNSGTGNDLRFTNLVNPIVSRISRQDTPVICVLTKGDKLKRFIGDNQYTLHTADDRPIVSENSPVFRQVTAPDDGEGVSAELAVHMAAANDIMRQIVDGAVAIGRDTPCFIVSAGTKNGEVINYNDSRNVLLPLVYLTRLWTA